MAVEAPVAPSAATLPPLLAPPAATARSSPLLMPRRASDISAATWLVYSRGSGLTEEWQERRRVWEGTWEGEGRGPAWGEVSGGEMAALPIWGYDLDCLTPQRPL